MITSNWQLNCACVDPTTCCKRKTSVYTKAVMNLPITEPIFKARNALSFVRRAKRREKKRQTFETIKPLLALVGIKQYSRHITREALVVKEELERRATVSGKQKNNLAAIAEKRYMDAILSEHDRLLQTYNQRKLAAVGIKFLLVDMLAGTLSPANGLLKIEYMLSNRKRDNQSPVWLSVRWTHTGIASIRD